MKVIDNLNLQFFAEGEEPAESQETPVIDQTSDEEIPSEKHNAELAAAKVELAKLKATLDKTLKEKGDITKKLREKQTNEERLAEEKAEEDRRRQEELESAKSELNHMKAVAAYKDIDDEKTIELLIEAVADGDHAAIATIIANERAKQKAIDDAAFKASRPSANVGDGNTPAMTKEEIFAVKDSAERRRLIAQNLNLFND